MPSSIRVQKIIELADELPSDERRDLEIALLDHDIARAEADPLPDWLKTELDRRLAEDTSTEQPWREALALLREQLRCIPE